MYATVRLGSTHGDVRVLRRRLVRLGFVCPGGGGDFDATLQRALVDWQVSAGLVADGVAGTRTWNALNAELDWHPDAERVPTWKHRQRTARPSRVVVHWTAAPASSDHADDNRARMRRWADRREADPKKNTSTHFVILRSGALLQCAPALSSVTSHAGAANADSVGVDLDNVGWLVETAVGLRDSYSGPYTGPEPVRTAKWRGRALWEPYTPEQVATWERLRDWLGAVLGPVPVVGHHELSRLKLDPGPHFASEAIG